MAHKAGYVNIIGEPNVGKSTLVNALLGEKLVITNRKAQTTRHRILGILNADEHQLILSDTPGILEPQYKLHKSMMRAVDEALNAPLTPTSAAPPSVALVSREPDSERSLHTQMARWKTTFAGA